MDEDTQIGSDVVVGKVPGDHGEDRPMMETAQTALLVRMSLLVRSRRWRVSYVACRGRRCNWWGTAEAIEPAEYCGASESASMAGMEESANAESMPLSE
jgi:hypothetical protein